MSLAYADVTIEAAQGSGAPGCEETADRCYLPNTVNVDIGERVIFSNTDSAAHTFTSGDPDVPNSIQTLFDSSLVMGGSTYEWTPSQEGEVPYFCMVHPWMEGMIIVGDSGTTTIPTPIPTTPPSPIIDDGLEKENQELRNQISDLKLENKQLKNKINSLNTEIGELKDQIVSMTKEFVGAIEQLNAWFGSQLS